MFINKKYLKSIIYGGTDGIITMFNIISGVTGAGLKSNIVYLLGVAALLGDAVSMGFSDFLSTKAENKMNSVNQNNHTYIDPKKNGLVTFISFIIFGSLPLISYVISNKFFKNNYLNSLISTAIALFILGSLQTKFTKRKWYKGGLSVTGYGLLASFITYIIATFISKDYSL